MREAVEKAALALLEYCKKENWVGYDPYDGLNSRLVRALPLFRSRTFRLVVTQAMKRSPVNLRPLLLVPKGENPKACALFCSSLIRLFDCGLVQDESIVRAQLQRLLELRSPGHSHYCWGYNFDWQSRGFFLPKFVPNIICTSFGGNALLDAYKRYGERRFLEAAASAGEFLITGLNISEEDAGICFSYTPMDRGQVHNANLLGAAFLGRLSSFTDRTEFRELAQRAARFSLDKQRADGSWPYGEDRSQKWVDNFHTGYNLVALWRLADVLNDTRVNEAVERGFRFYIDHFFTANGVPKYYDNRVWPIDIHSAAQSIVSLSELAALDMNAEALADKVCGWVLRNMRHKGGPFFYQKTRLLKNRICYMRWSQAWMLYAMSIFLSRCAGGPASSNEKRSL